MATSKKFSYVIIWKITHKMAKELAKSRMDSAVKVIHLAILKEYKKYLKEKKNIKVDDIDLEIAKMGDPAEIGGIDDDSSTSETPETSEEGE